MSAESLGDVTGLWRRSLLVQADGLRDTRTDVVWLQGITAYVDSRGFAGRLQQCGDVFVWHRDIDLAAPGPFLDAGSMRRDGDTLIEVGVYEDYVEHWDRFEASNKPCWALWLSAEGPASALLVRVGETFGWAAYPTVVVGDVGDEQWRALKVKLSRDDLRVDGRRWIVEGVEGGVEL